jgi:hypothetical protein
VSFKYVRISKKVTFTHFKLLLHSAGSTTENHEKISVMTVVKQVEIRTDNLQNTSQMHYHYSSLFGIRGCVQKFPD